MAKILYSGDPLRYPYPGLPMGVANEMSDRASQDLRLVSDHYPGFREHVSAIHPAGDFEDFWEATARAAAAVRAAQCVGADFEPRAAMHQDGWTEPDLGERLGPVARGEEARHARDLLTSPPLVKSFGGRWMSFAGYTDEPGEFEPEHDVVELVLARALAGVSRLVVKFTARKTGVFTLFLSPDMTRDDIRDALIAGDRGWHLIRLAGVRDSLLIQDWIPMWFEYRLFIVDGALVSGAGCVEEFTPYHRANPQVRFDDRVRASRGNGIAARESTRVVSMPDLVDRYMRVGHQLAKLHAGTVVVDLAQTTHDQIVIVEMNSLPNAGLYASNTDAVYAAWARARDRGYGYDVAPRVPLDR